MRRPPPGRQPLKSRKVRSQFSDIVMDFSNQDFIKFLEYSGGLVEFPAAFIGYPR
jgi:hypothetical protein